MPLVKKNVAKISASLTAVAPGLWAFGSDTDSIITIMQDGYFDSMSTELTKGDNIQINDSAGNTSTIQVWSPTRQLPVVTAQVPFRHQFIIAQYGNNQDGYRTRNINTNGSFEFNFIIPEDFTRAEKIALIGFPSAGAAGTGKDIDLTTVYGGIGENNNTHSESDVGTVYDLGAVSDFFEIPLLPVLNFISAGDIVGLTADHNGIGGTAYYMGIKLIYN